MEKRTRDMKKDFSWGSSWYGGGISVVILCFLLISCGARKTHKAETVETVKADSISKIKETVVSESELNKEASVCEENFTIEPIDTIKPIEITDASGKVTKYRNARLKKGVKISSEKTAYSDKTVKISRKEEKKAVVSTKESSEKGTEREAVFNKWFFAIPLLLIALIIAVYMIYKKKIEEIV